MLKNVIEKLSGKCIGHNEGHADADIVHGSRANIPHDSNLRLFRGRG
jgi:hypothetical protein